MTATDIHVTRRRPARQRARWTVPGPTAVFSWLSIITLFFISHLALTALGLAYEAPGGSPLEKIAPGTYFAVLATVSLFAERNPIGLLNDIVRRHKGFLLFCGCWVMLFSYIYLFQGPPLTATFDTFLLPIMMFVVVPRLSERTQRNMVAFLHAFMALNALFGVAEFALGFRMTPVVAQGMELTDEWRSTAFLGHPLMNATMTSCYVGTLLVGGGREIPKSLWMPAFILQCAGLAVFGGRLATVVGVAAIGIAFAYWVLRYAAGKRFSLTTAAIAAIAIPLFITAVAGLAAGGFFDKFLMRFVDDAGSADTRVKMFDLLDQIPFNDMLVGADAQFVATLQRLTGIAFGIESFWVGFIAYYGILISIPFFIGLIAFCVSLARFTRPGAGWVILQFMILCSGSASLSGKGTLLGTFVIMVVLFLRRPLGDPRAPTRAAA